MIIVQHVYCLDCDFRNYALTEYHVISLGAKHGTETGHSVTYTEVEMLPEDFHHKSCGCFFFSMPDEG